MPSYVCGLDLGQAADPSALVIVERHEDLGYDPATVQTFTTWSAGGGDVTTRQAILEANGRVQYVDELPAPQLLSYDVRHALRFPLGTPYPQIVGDVVRLLHQPPLAGKVRLIIDATGVGRPVVDMFSRHPERRFPVVPVVITAGDTVTKGEDGSWRVPKRDLVGAVQVELQNKRLRFPDPKKLPTIDVLTHELSQFRVTISAAGHDSYEAWRERDHDDLVLALAVALWYGVTRYSTGVYI